VGKASKRFSLGAVDNKASMCSLKNEGQFTRRKFSSVGAWARTGATVNGPRVSAQLYSPKVFQPFGLAQSRIKREKVSSAS